MCTFFLLIAGAGVSVRVVSTNDTKHEIAEESQQAGDRRSTDNDQCYRQFFVGKQPPTGFKNKNITYICQKSGKTPCFSTMFDLSYGIPVYSAYVVKKSQASKFSKAKRNGLNFRQEPGK